MVEWSTIQALLLLFGPIVYSRTARFLRTLRRPSNQPLKPLDRSTRHLLNLLFFSAFTSLLITFPRFLPENIISLTNSHLTQTSTSLVFSRLSHIRPLKPTDDLLRERLSTKEGRYLYAHYGPSVLTSCTYCTTDNPDSFLYYSLPLLAIPHLLHILILGLVTSSWLSQSTPYSAPSYRNPSGKLFRTQATIAGISIALVELYYMTYWTDYRRANLNAITRKDVTWTHWNVIFYRGIAIALVDGLLGYAIFLAGTNRWNLSSALDGPESPQAKIEHISKMLEKSVGGINSSVCLKQTVLRDRDLRDRMVQFWDKEELVGREIGEVEEVKAVRFERERKPDWLKVVSEAQKRAEGVVKGLFVKRKPAEEIIAEHERKNSTCEGGDSMVIEEQSGVSELDGIDGQDEGYEDDVLSANGVDMFTEDPGLELDTTK